MAILKLEGLTQAGLIVQPQTKAPLFNIPNPTLAFAEGLSEHSLADLLPLTGGFNLTPRKGLGGAWQFGWLATPFGGFRL